MLRRTPLKSRDTTTAEVRALRSSYIEAFPACQYCIALAPFERFACLRSPICCEHIFARRGPASECWANYATTCDPAHRWKTENSIEGRIAILNFKWRLMRSTGDARHFDQMAFKDFSGYRLAGWLENKIETHPMDQFFIGKAQEILRGIA